MGYFSCFTWSSSAIFGWYESRSNVHIYYRNTFCLFKKSLAFFFQFLIISIPVFGAYGLLELGSRREVCLMVWFVCVTCSIDHQNGKEGSRCSASMPVLGLKGSTLTGEVKINYTYSVYWRVCTVFLLSVATSLCCFSPLCSHQVVLFLISL